jgi:threonine dehydratase
MRTSLPLQAIFEALDHIRPYLDATPLHFSPALSDYLGAQVWLKLECRQPTGSFKVRGALNKLSHLQHSMRDGGVISASAGNHGLGVAFAAQKLGIQAVTIVIPHTAAESKRDRLKGFDIELIEEGKTYEEAHQTALQLATERDWTYIPAYDDVEIIAGQGTIGLEIMQQHPATEIVVVPVGGGGLIAGIASAAKQINPICEVIGIQAAASPAGRLSLQNGQPFDPYDHEPTIADGLAGGFGKIPFYLARMLIDRIELCSEQELKEAVYALLKHEQIVAEPSGAISVHPNARADENWQGRQVVCVISGGNLSMPLLRQILRETEE